MVICLMACQIHLSFFRHIYSSQFFKYDEEYLLCYLSSAVVKPFVILEMSDGKMFRKLFLKANLPWYYTKLFCLLFLNMNEKNITKNQTVRLTSAGLVNTYLGICGGNYALDSNLFVLTLFLTS